MILSDIRCGRVYGDNTGNAFEVVSIYGGGVAYNRPAVRFRIVASVDDNLPINRFMQLPGDDFLKWVKADLGPNRGPHLHINLLQQLPKVAGWYMAFIPGVTAAPLFVQIVEDEGVFRPANTGFVVPDNLPIFWSPRIEFNLVVPENQPPPAHVQPHDTQPSVPTDDESTGPPTVDE